MQNNNEQSSPSNRREKYNSVLNEVPTSTRKHKLRLYGIIAIVVFSAISLFLSQFLVQNIFQSDMHKQIKGADITVPSNPSSQPSSVNEFGYELFVTDTLKISE